MGFYWQQLFGSVFSLDNEYSTYAKSSGEFINAVLNSKQYPDLCDEDVHYFLFSIDDDLISLCFKLIYGLAIRLKRGSPIHLKVNLQPIVKYSAILLPFIQSRDGFPHY